MSKNELLLINQYKDFQNYINQDFQKTKDELDENLNQQNQNDEASVNEARIFAFLFNFFFVISDIFVKIYSLRYHQTGLLIYNSLKNTCYFVLIFSYMKYKGLKIISLLDFGRGDSYIRNLNIFRLILYNIANPLITLSISLVKLSMFSLAF